MTRNPDESSTCKERIAELEAERNALKKRVEQCEAELQTLHRERRKSADSVKQEGSNFLEAINERIEHAATLSEDAALETGSRINESLSLARSFLEQTQSLAAEVGTDSAIAHALEALTQLVQDFVDTVQEELVSHRDVVRDALRAADEVSKAGRQIREIAQATYILNLNAQVEAARLGERGRAFAVITEQMTKLSASTSEANEAVEELAIRLSQDIPALAESSENLAKKHSEFGSEMSTSLKGLAKAEKHLRERFMGTLDQGEQNIQCIVEHSRIAVSRMQFQDPMVQALRQLPHLGSELIRMTRNSLLDEQQDDPNTTYTQLIDPMRLPDTNPYEAESLQRGGEVLLF
ncbi:MAG: methyl-accepting chemotaxis protein [Myxococcota bacterium]